MFGALSLAGSDFLASGTGSAIGIGRPAALIAAPDAIDRNAPGTAAFTSIHDVRATSFVKFFSGISDLYIPGMAAGGSKRLRWLCPEGGGCAATHGPSCCVPLTVVDHRHCAWM
jgi:hypothetical protein